MTTDEATAVRLSGWCSPAPGARHTEYEHAACDRFRSGCECPAFRGHSGARNIENPALLHGSEHFETVESDPQNKRVPAAFLPVRSGDSDRRMERRS